MCMVKIMIRCMTCTYMNLRCWQRNGQKPSLVIIQVSRLVCGSIQCIQGINKRKTKVAYFLIKLDDGAS